MTTDTFPKGATATAPSIGGVEVTINGIAKGAGMIAPDMATMLSFVFTDAPIAAAALQAMLSTIGRRARSTPSRSTATPRPPTRCCCSPPAPRGQAARRGSTTPPTAVSPASARRSTRCCSTSPTRWCSDGEGARKFVGSTSRARSSAARRAAHRHVDRQLAAGEDRRSRARTPIGAASSMAVGKAGEPADRDRLAICVRRYRVAPKGLRDPAYDEAKVSAYMKGAGDRHPRRHRPGQRACDGVDLRPHQGVCRDQRRLPPLRRRAQPG